MSTAQFARISSALPDDPQLRRALIACSAALDLDDESALTVIRLAIGAKSSGELLWELKSSGSVWQRADGTWKLLDKVRAEGASLLDRELGSGIAAKVQSVMIRAALRRAEKAAGETAVAIYAKRRATLEAAYLRLRSGLEAREAASDLLTLWLGEEGPGRVAVVQVMDRLAADLWDDQFSSVVLFFRGLAAEARGDRDRAIQLLTSSAASARNIRAEDLRMAAVALFEYARVAAGVDLEKSRQALETSEKLWPDAAHQGRVRAFAKELLRRR